MNHNVARTTQVMALALALLASAGPAQSQDKPSREREALRRVQQALRVAQEEQGTLQRDKSQLAAEKDLLARDKGRLDDELKRTASRAGSAQAEARAAQARASQLEADLSAAKSALDALQTQHDLQGAQLRESQARVVAVSAMLERSTHAQRMLQARNEQLYKVGLSVVELYRSRKPADTLARQEPVLGMAAVTLENVAEIWLDRLEEARFKDDASSASQARP